VAVLFPVSTPLRSGGESKALDWEIGPSLIQTIGLSSILSRGNPSAFLIGTCWFSRSGNVATKKTKKTNMTVLFQTFHIFFTMGLMIKRLQI
jgi:hypothetical protein